MTIQNKSQEIIVKNPVTEQEIGRVKVASASEVADAVERARFAQVAWGKLTVGERGQFLRRWLDILWEHQSEGIRLLREENGKTDASAFLEFATIDNVTQYYIHQAPSILAPERRRTLFPLIQWAKVHHKPHGVVGIITPWNYPFALPFIDMVAALMAGNTVVLKPSETTPLIAQFGVDFIYQAGIPRDVVQIVNGGGETGAALVDEVDYIQFTGSTSTGIKVGKRAVERLIPHSLELGGKDAAIVLPDADLNITAVHLIHGAFENKGQMCISIERVYVHESVHDELVDLIKHHAKKLTISTEGGFDAVVGSMTNRAEYERTLEHIQDAVSKGAEVVVGGQPRPDVAPLVIEPAVLTHVDHSMDIMRDETFGAVMPIMKYSNIEEAIRLANDSPYGLSASIFSRDLSYANELALRLNTGDVNINRAQYVTGTPSLPSGGQKQSGTGRRNGREGLLKYTYSQSILTDTLLIKDESLVIATPPIIKLVNIMRTIRRYIPFI